MKKVLSFLRSMRFGMLLLILVMLCSLAGSLVVQQSPAMAYVNEYGAETAKALLFLGITDIFHTWYFDALTILLCLNLLLCSIVRFPQTLKAADALKARTLAAPPECEVREPERLAAFLRARRFREERRDGVQLFFKNRCGFFGSFLTHLSILLVLFFGSLVLMTPEVTDQTVMPGETLTLSDGTTVCCDSFHILDETGKLDYASTLFAQSADGAHSKAQEIRVNEPMRFGEYKIYQQTYGTAGRVRIANNANGAVETLYLTEPCFLSIDGQNGIYFSALYPGFTRDAEGNYTLMTSTSGRYTDPVYQIQSISGGMSASVLAFPDESISIGDITFTFLSPAEYPGLRIKRVSSALYGGLYFSFGLMVLALYLCFFAVPVCVKVTPSGYAVGSPKDASGLMLDIRAAQDAKEN